MMTSNGLTKPGACVAGRLQGCTTATTVPSPQRWPAPANHRNDGTTPSRQVRSCLWSWHDCHYLHSSPRQWCSSLHVEVLYRIFACSDCQQSSHMSILVPHVAPQAGGRGGAGGGEGEDLAAGAPSGRQPAVHALALQRVWELCQMMRSNTNEGGSWLLCACRAACTAQQAQLFTSIEEGSVSRQQGGRVGSWTSPRLHWFHTENFRTYSATRTELRDY